MPRKFDPQKNYEKTRKAIGFVPRNKATRADYERIGFMSGLEVHQQIRTVKKLFCNCPAGIFHKHHEYHAELIRHMRPTLSELGEYDGTALMEFKTRKEIVYRINNRTACTYEVDDTPPFPLNREALEYALEISLASRLNIVGEVHITRKQYLDGSIPTGFQRTAILGVEGEIELSNKKVRLLQLSIEEDSCREISDIGHVRVYKTDRLGMPLIETVTYPDMLTPDELMEAAQYIRFLNRSTGRVRTGIGSGREDVNVSCAGGTRVEIKGLSHNKWIPLLSHNEAFRQWALLHVRKTLVERISDHSSWKPTVAFLDFDAFNITYEPLKVARDRGHKLVALNLPDFKGILSHFTQPGKTFASELAERLKVIACLEHPNMIHSEQQQPIITQEDFDILGPMLNAKEDDAQVVIWGPSDDMATAIETIEERCRMAFVGVPNETRRPLPDGTTVFERVLPGADRMYPDTDSAPIPLANEYIEELKNRVPVNITERFHQLRAWGVPEDTFVYILKKNLVPLIERLVNEIGVSPVRAATFLGHKLKHIEGNRKAHPDFNVDRVFDLFLFLKNNDLEWGLAIPMLPLVYENPNMDFQSVLTLLKFRKRTREELIAPVEFLFDKYRENSSSKHPEGPVNWLMGQLRKPALGNIPLAELKNNITTIINA